MPEVRSDAKVAGRIGGCRSWRGHTQYDPRMKHATSVALDTLEPLLVQIRALGVAGERKRGIFYKRSSAFLHFHEDPAGFFADLRTGPVWTRFPATAAKDRRALIAAIKRWS